MKAKLSTTISIAKPKPQTIVVKFKEWCFKWFNTRLFKLIKDDNIICRETTAEEIAKLQKECDAPTKEPEESEDDNEDQQDSSDSSDSDSNSD